MAVCSVERERQRMGEEVLFRPQEIKHQPLGDGWRWEGGSLMVGYGRVLRDTPGPSAFLKCNSGIREAIKSWPLGVLECISHWASSKPQSSNLHLAGCMVSLLFIGKGALTLLIWAAGLQMPRSPKLCSRTA